METQAVRAAIARVLDWERFLGSIDRAGEDRVPVTTIDRVAQNLVAWLSDQGYRILQAVPEPEEQRSERSQSAMVKANRYSHRKVKNRWVTIDIRTQTFVRWFRSEEEASRWTRLINHGMPLDCTGDEPEWRDKLYVFFVPLSAINYDDPLWSNHPKHYLREGLMTVGHPASADGQPVIVDDNGRAYGPADTLLGHWSGAVHQRRNKALEEAAASSGWDRQPNPGETDTTY